MVNLGSNVRVEELIRDDCRVINDDIAEHHEISYEVLQRWVGGLGFATICAW